MKQVGFMARLFAVAAVLVVAALVVSGCGSKKDSSSGSGSTGGGTVSSNGSKTYSASQGLGDSKKVVVDSGQSFDAEQQAIVDQISAFGDATASKNYKKLCNDILSKSAQKIGGDCVKTFEQTGSSLTDFKITVKSVDVAKGGKTAKADVSVTSNTSPKAQAQQLSLTKENGEWRIQILGQ